MEQTNSNDGLNKILRYLIIAGIFLVPFLALIVSTTMFFPFITGKHFTFRILTEIILVLWLILALRDPSFRPRRSWILYAVTIYTFILILSTIFGENPFRSFWSNYERMYGLVAQLHFFAYFLVAISVLTRERLWYWFFHVSLGVAAIMSFYGFLQLAGKAVINQGGVRLDATFGNATYLAVYMLFHIMLAAYFFFRHQGNKLVRWVYPALIIIYTIILYYTATRGVVLGFLAGIFLSLLLVAVFDRGRARIVAASLIGLWLVFIAGFVLIKDTKFVRDSEVLGRFAGISLTSGTSQSRYIIWGMSLKAAAEHPILGWGPDNYNLVFNQYYDPRLWPQEQWFDRSHNVIFDELIAGGILGLFAYLAIFGFALYFLWRDKNFFSVRDKSILTGLLAAYFFQLIFVFDNLASSVLFYSVVGYICVMVSGSNFRVWQGRQFSVLTRNTAAAALLVALVFGIYFINVKPIIAAQELILAISGKEGGLPQMLESFKKIFAMRTFASIEAREQLTGIAIKVVQSPDVPVDLREQFAQLTVDQMNKQLELSPTDSRQHLFAAVFYLSLKQPAVAEEHFKKALEFSPRKQTIMFELAGAYISSGRYEDAYNVLKTAYELDPSFGLARLNYAAALIYTKRLDALPELLKDLSEQTVFGNDSILNAYATIGAGEQVIAIWSWRIKDNPTNVRNYIGLSSSYLGVGRRAESIEVLQKAIEVDSSFKEQGEIWINEIKSGRNP